MASRSPAWLAIAAGSLFALPVLVARGLPMTDLPLHEGMVALLLRFGDPSFTRGIYALNLGHTGQLFHFLALPLAQLVGTNAGCRVLVALTILATFVGTSRLCDHVGASRWAALLVAPAVVGWVFFFGSAPNLLGTAIFVLALPDLDRLAESPTPRRALGGCGILFLLHAAHELSAAAACLSLVTLSLGRRGGGRAWALRCAPIAIAAVLALVEMKLESSVLTGFARKWLARGVTTTPVRVKLTHAIPFLMGEQGHAEDTMMSLLLVAAVAALIAGREKGKRATLAAPESRLVRYRFEALAGALFAAYLAAPFAINFGAFLYVRFLAPAFLVGVIALARGARPSLGAKLLCGAVPAAWLIIIIPQFLFANREEREIERLFARMQPGSSFAVLGYGETTRPYNAIAPGNRALAVLGGRALHSLTEYPTSPVIIRDGVRWDEEVLRVYARPEKLRPEWDMTRFRYLLVRVPEIQRAFAIDGALGPDAAFVKAAGSWSLFETTHPIVAVDAPDAPLPSTPPPTLEEAVHAWVPPPQ